MQNTEPLKTKENIESALSFINQHLKTIVLFISGYGFINLIYFCKANNIPFPLSFSALSMVFIIITVITLLLCVAIICVFLAPAFFQADLFEAIYQNDRYGLVKNILLFIGLSGLFILLVSFIPYVEFKNWIPYDIKWLYKIIYSTLLVTTVLISIYIINKIISKDRLTYVIMVLAFNLISCLWILIVYFVLSKFFTSINQISILTPILIVLMIPCIYLFTLPKSKKVFYCFLLIGFSMTISFASDYTRKALEICKLGGGYKTIYYIEKNNIENIPDTILSNIKTGETHEMSVLLNLGDMIYVRPINSNASQATYGIKRAYIASEKIL